MTRKPSLGDRIAIPDSFTDKIYSGIVLDRLSTQFTYQLADGTIRYAFYSADWKYK